MTLSAEDIRSWKIDLSDKEEKRLDYTVKSHPEDSDKPSIITFKGNTKSFIDAAQNARNILNKRGASKEIDGIEAKVLDVKAKGSVEVTLQVKDDKGRGNAIVEFYNPKKKSTQCSIVMKKSKDYDERYVKIIAHKVVQPILDAFLNNDLDETNVNDVIKNIEKSEEKSENNLNKRKRPFINYAESDENTSMEIDSEFDDKMEVDMKSKEEKKQNNKLCNKRNDQSKEKDINHQQKNKKQKEEEIKVIIENKFDNEKVKDIPDSVKPIISNDVNCIYTVAGDGSCGASSAAVFLFGDEIYGHNLRKMINEFMAHHFQSKYKLKTPFPLERNIGNNKKVTFQNEEEFCEFLLNSKESSHMWMDSEDLCVLSDLFQLNIKIISTDSISSVPTVNNITPDKVMKKYAKADLAEKELVLIHENDDHFNVVLPRSENITKKGSLSKALFKGISISDFILNKQHVKENIDKDSNKIADHQSNDYNKLKEEYDNTIMELRRKTEQLEKIKIELRDINQIKDLDAKLEGKTMSEPTEREETNPSPIEKPQTTVREKTNPSTIEKSKPTSRDSQFNCNDCDFQTTSVWFLNKHRNIKHCNESNKEGVTCNQCNVIFYIKSEFMVHRKNEHIEMVGRCRKFKEGQCPFSSKHCWWRHDDNTYENKEPICVHCKMTFETRRHLMSHMKENHPSSVPICKKFENKDCRFNDKFCWFRHTTLSQKQDFHKAAENPDPPSQ